jgi:hypothetical protein
MILVHTSNALTTCNDVSTRVNICLDHCLWSGNPDTSVASLRIKLSALMVHGVTHRVKRHCLVGYIPQIVECLAGSRNQSVNFLGVSIVGAV